MVVYRVQFAASAKPKGSYTVRVKEQPGKHGNIVTKGPTGPASANTTPSNLPENLQNACPESRLSAGFCSGICERGKDGGC